MFQFTHPGGVRLLVKMLLMALCLFQFTHPGGVRRLLVPTDQRGGNVSIHAPGRGATWYRTPLLSSILCFNSRTREGCDSLVRMLWMVLSQVSIHAPGRGATSSRHRHCALHRVSIHAPGRGATMHNLSECTTLKVSIHAPGRGATSPRDL